MKICPQCKQVIKTNRTNQQNSYYWVCMTTLGNELGNTPEEQSEIIKLHFKWYKTLKDKDGNEVISLESSADWDKELFSMRTETIIQFAAELGIYLMTPQEFFNQTKNSYAG